jgi:hypothetical protein
LNIENEACPHTFSILTIFDLGIREGGANANKKYVFIRGSAAQFFVLGTNNLITKP